MKTRIIQGEPRAGDSRTPRKRRAAAPATSCPQPRGPDGPLERRAPQERDLGLARVRRRRVRDRQNVVGHEAASPTSISSSGESGTCRAGAGPRRPAAGRRGRPRQERQADGRGPRVPRSGRGRHRPSRSRIQYVKNVKSPLDGATAVSADGHAALVELRDRRRFDRGRGPRRSQLWPPSPRCRTSIPDLVIEQFGGASAGKADRRGRSATTSRRREMLSLPDHADHPHRHLRVAGGGRRAAAASGSRP